MKRTSEHAGAFVHTAEPQSAARTSVLCVEADTIVHDTQSHGSNIAFESDGDTAGFRMFDQVVECFLENSVNAGCGFILENVVDVLEPLLELNGAGLRDFEQQAL